MIRVGRIVVVSSGFLLAGMLHGCTDVFASRGETCPANLWTETSNRVAVEVLPGQPVRTDFGAGFIGFNLPWFNFQDGLVDETSGRVRQDLIGYMSRFSGAYFRYPGGTLSNYFDWSKAVGPQEGRQAQKATGWSAPRVVRFGLQEYFDFLEGVQGRPWYVVNIYGRYGSEMDMPALQGELQGLLGYFRPYTSNWQKKQQQFSFELGNELDRDAYGWSAEKYASRGTAIARQISEAQANARLIVPLEDFDALPGRTASEYNRAVVRQLPPSVSDYALHPYYAGRPGGPPVNNRLRHVCAVLDDIKAERPDAQPRIWLTEHGRWPQGKINSDEWKANKARLNNLEGTLHVGDFLIGAAQIAPVKAAFLHALHASDAPWALFVRDRNQDKLVPTALYQGLLLLKENMAANVLPSRTLSPNSAGIDGGHDVRALVMQEPGQAKYRVWLVNHAHQQQAVTLKIPAIASRVVLIERRYLTHVYAGANNTAFQADTLATQTALSQSTANQMGEVELAVPMHSLSAITIAVEPVPVVKH